MRDLSYDENTQSISIGTRDWLEASEEMQVRSYLPPVDNVDITGVPAEHKSRDEANPRHREDFDRLLESVARSSE